MKIVMMSMLVAVMALGCGGKEREDGDYCPGGVANAYAPSWHELETCRPDGLRADVANR